MAGPPNQTPPKATKRPLLDPATRDWIITKGRLEDDETHASTVLWLLDHHRGTSAAYPDVGSRFWTIRKILPNTPRTVEIMAFEALNPLIRDRKITNVEAAARRAGQVLIELKVNWRDHKGKKNAIRRVLTIGRPAL